MTVHPSPYTLLRGLQDQIAVLQASLAAIDRTANVLAGILDKSAPDPILNWSPPRPIVEPPPSKVVAPPAPLAEGEARVLPVPRCSRRINGETARPPVLFKLQGVEVKTTQRRVDLINAVSAEPLTLKAMVAKGLAPSVAGIKAQIYDTNLDLDAAGSPLRVRMKALPAQRRGARGGREPAVYALLPAKGHETTPPDNLHAAQSEGASGAGEGEAAPVDPAPAADAKPIHRSDDALPIVPAGPPAASTRPPAGPLEGKPIALRAVNGGLTIEPGDLLAVDIRSRRVQTARGSYEVGGANLARALDAMKGGHLFGLDVIARKAGWPTAEVAKTALSFERARLAQHGIEVWTDKVNARLREAS